MAQEISSRGFGLPWGHTRTYGNRVTAPDEGLNGSSWFVKEIPQLVQDANSNVAFIGIINDALWFDYNSGTDSYTGRYFILDTLTHDTTNKRLVYINTLGQTIKFFDFDASYPAAKRGQFYSFTDAADRETLATYGTNDLISSFEQVAGAKSSSYFYAFFSSGTNANRLQYATYKADGVNVRRAQYDYYDGTDSFGTAGDLKRVTTQQWDATNSVWVTLGVTYYRYYKSGDTDGFAHGLKYVLSPLGYAEMVASGITPEISTDSQLANFSKHLFKYNSDNSVKNEVVNNGRLNFGFVVTTSSFSDGYNNWKNKTAETLPDGNKNIVYTNYAGQVILKIFSKVVNGVETVDKWYEYYQYDGSGRMTMKAESSAVLSYTENTAGLVTLQTNAGFIHLYSYYGANPPSGGAPGYRQDEKVQQGSGGSPILLKAWQYSSRTVGSTTLYALSQETVNQSDSGGGSSPATTSYSYTWQNAFQIDQVTKTFPVVPTTQNGSGTADTRADAFDAYGRVIWSKDERGYISGFTYDLSTDGLTQRVDDASTGTPWTPLAGSHLNLVTDYTVDSQGRTTQELGPAHDVDLSGTSTNIRRATWTVYKDDTFQTWQGFGYQQTSNNNFTAINPVKITKMDSIGRVTDEIQATRASASGKLAPTDSFAQSAYVRWSRNNYQNSLSLASKWLYYLIPSSGGGVKATNYNETSYAYDIMKRPNRSKSSGGTISWTVYHVRGWVLENWVGTNDLGATAADPSGGGATGNNMVKVTSFEYDSNAAAGDGNLTKTTQYQDATNTRVTAYS